MKFRKLSMEKTKESNTGPSNYRIQPRLNDDKLKPSISENSLQSKMSLQARKKISNPIQTSKIQLEKIKVGNTEIVPGTLQIDDRLKYQIELAAKESEIMQEFERRFKLKMSSIKGDEKRNIRAFFILFKKACMVFGRYQAELFVKKEFNISMPLFFKKYDLDQSYWVLS